MNEHREYLEEHAREIGLAANQLHHTLEKIDQAEYYVRHSQRKLEDAKKVLEEYHVELDALLVEWAKLRYPSGLAVVETGIPYAAGGLSPDEAGKLLSVDNVLLMDMGTKDYMPGRVASPVAFQQSFRVKTEGDGE